MLLVREPPAFWYEPHPLGVLLAPLGWLYALGAVLRRGVYRAGVRRSRRVGCPIVVVGNLCVGGAGKTPLVVAIVKLLARRGLRAGIVCRGYGGRAGQWPQHVHSGSDPGRVGDEAVLLARRAAVPVVAGPDRVAAARALCGHTECDVVLSDDGLQHLRLARDVEIVVVDGAWRHGNGRCLPAGPLREPLSRLASVDLVVVNGDVWEGNGVGKEEDPGDEVGEDERESPGEGGNEPDMWLAAGDAVSLLDPETTCPLDAFRGAPVHALCGIGHPERFFRTLESRGLTIVRHPFPDHHPFRETEIAFPGAAPILMTEKDAVKCERFADVRHWYVPVEAVLSRTFEARLAACLRKRGVIAMEPGSGRIAGSQPVAGAIPVPGNPPAVGSVSIAGSIPITETEPVPGATSIAGAATMAEDALIAGTASGAKAATVAGNAEDPCPSPGPPIFPEPGCVVVIPARYASARLPGKPLVDIAGKPMIVRVYERALASGVGPVIVASDDERVVAVSQAHGAEAALTSGAHASGTDRIAEVVEAHGLDAATVVVNVQGDEPLLPPGLIAQVATNLSRREDFAIATLCEIIEREDDIFDPAVVKVVFDEAGRAAYFSRAPIPYCRGHFDTHPKAVPAHARHYRHIGLYAYRAGFLRRFASLAPAPSERAESLEQLRAIHHGESIHVEIAREPAGPGVDTPADLERVRTVFARCAWKD